MIKKKSVNQVNVKVLAFPGFKLDQNIRWVKGSPFRECTPDELKVISQVPQSVFIFKDKQGNIINKPKEAKNVHKNRKPKQSKGA